MVTPGLLCAMGTLLGRVCLDGSLGSLQKDSDMENQQIKKDQVC